MTSWSPFQIHELSSEANPTVSIPSQDVMGKAQSGNICLQKYQRELKQNGEHYRLARLK